MSGSMFRPNPIQKRRARRALLCTGQLLTLTYTGIDLGLINQSELRKGYEHAWVCEESPTKQFEILGRQGSSGRHPGKTAGPIRIVQISCAHSEITLNSRQSPLHHISVYIR
jgi:hypothetical protein